MIRIAFAGFRHAHIMSMYNACMKLEGFDVVAACEEHPETRQELKANGKVEITHDNYTKMLEEVECDAVAIGDYYGKRGKMMIEGLKHGRHVIADKPICTSLVELDEMEKAAAEARLCIGCMLDARDSGRIVKVRELIRGGVIGDVHGITMGGQHPLMYGTRPSWYFEEGKHGGTINDIAIHAFDFVPWITGLDFAEIVAARSWNACLPEVPYFHDAGQFMARMSNNCGFLCDVSYFMPNSFGYSLEMYWRMTYFGKDGIIEASQVMPTVFLARNGEKEVQHLDPSENVNSGYLHSFAADIEGGEPEMTTADVIRASRTSLLAQQAAFDGKTHVLT